MTSLANQCDDILATLAERERLFAEVRSIIGDIQNELAELPAKLAEVL
jgi:hypothetical protein